MQPDPATFLHRLGTDRAAGKALRTPHNTVGDWRRNDRAPGLLVTLAEAAAEVPGLMEWLMARARERPASHQPQDHENEHDDGQHAERP